jgi:hypothetical protein
MAWLGMFCLGAFIGFVITYGLTKTTNWENPGNVFTSAISAAVAGGIFTFIEFLGGTSLGSALFLYPVGLAYGALCANIRWVTGNNVNWWIAGLHIGAFAAASVALSLLFVWQWFRSLLPTS